MGYLLSMRYTINMYMYIFIVGYIGILLGGDWSMIFMFPVGNGQIIPIDELILSEGVQTTKQNILL